MKKVAIREPKKKKINKKKEIKNIQSTDGSVKTFEEIGISTKTVIGISNLKIDLEKFYKYMPITDFEAEKKKRGRKRKVIIPINTNNLPFGSINFVQIKRESRGTPSKVKSKDSEKKTFFLHSVTFEIVLDNNKHINAKISTNGKFQITGCKSDDHFIQTGVKEEYIRIVQVAGSFSMVDDDDEYNDDDMMVMV
jgi:hypothetical protein